MSTGALWIRIGAVFASLAVIAGAFGAHYLKERLSIEPRLLETFETGVRYQMYHALAILAVGLLLITGHASHNLATAAAVLFLLGILAFSGSLYGITFGVFPSRILGPITPLGGLAFIAGWILLALAVKTPQL